MQEVLPFTVNHANMRFDYRVIGRGLKWLFIGVWKPVRWLLEAMFTQSPQQEYIEQNRVKAMRLIGHF